MAMRRWVTYQRLAVPRLLALVTVLSITIAFTGCRQKQRDLLSYLDAAQEMWGFEGAVLVAYDGQPIISRGYGWANPTFEIPNTATTRFFVGSITKQFTAAAILLLQEDGLLTVHDSIVKYLPDYPSPQSHQITIHHLLTHTSGIPNYTDDPQVALRRMDWIPPDSIPRMFKYRPLEFEPGTRFSYSNSNYVLLGLIVEQVSGQSYEAFLHRRILKPLRMFNTGYARLEAGIPNRADGYTADDQGQQIDALPVHPSLLHSAGALYSTVTDLLRWEKALSTSELFSADSRNKMFDPYEHGYGYGWFLDSLYGRRRSFHGGFIDGYNCTLERWPDDHLFIVVLSNDDVSPVKKTARGLAAICFDKPYDFPVEKQSVPLSRELVDEYVGAYQVGDQVRVIQADGDRIYTYVHGLPREQLLPLGRDTLCFEGDNTLMFYIVRDEDGRVAGHVIRDQFTFLSALRLSDDAAARYLQSAATLAVPITQLQRYVGTFELDTDIVPTEAPLTVRTYIADSALHIVTAGISAARLRPVAPDRFCHSVADYTLTFHRDSIGRVTGLTLEMAGAEVQGRKID